MEREKLLLTNVCWGRKAKVVLVVMLMITATFLWFSPKVTAATTAVTISPNTGTVGTVVRVNGTIDTPNGAYVVRWNQTLNITSGYAVENNVNASFIVPQTVGNSTGRDISVELIDNATNSVGTATFKLYTAYHIKALTPSPPNQLQEGATTDILVNVTGGTANTVYVANVTVKNPANVTDWSMVSLTNTTANGFGEGSLHYPEDLVGAHTNYTGTYHLAFNGTVAEASFAVGLTNATEYRRFEVVNIRAMNYTAQPQEQVWVNVTRGATVVFSQNVSAVDGVVDTSWRIPGNATIGTYTVKVSNSTASGTVKSVPDVQTFKIVRALSSLGVRVKAAGGQPLAGVTVDVYNLTQVGSKTTNIDGWVDFSLDVGNYTVKGLVYDLLFNTTFVDVPLGSHPNITMVCPAYTLFVRVFDSKDNPSEGVTVYVYEWTSGVAQPEQSEVTDAGGNAEFSLNFGRYRLRTYRDSALLNETVVDLTQDDTLSTIRCSIYNVDLSVFVTDYFRQPIPNAVVKFERRVDSDYVVAHTSATRSDGSVVFNGIIGGEARISVYVNGKLSQTQYLYLDGSRRVATKIDGYVVVGGFVLEASQFFTLAVVLIIIALFLITWKYKTVLQFFSRRKKTP